MSLQLTDRLSEILEQYNRYPLNEGETIEIEARFGHFDSRSYFNASVDKQMFDNLKWRLSSKAAPLIEFSKDYINSSEDAYDAVVRNSIINDPEGINPRKIQIQKSNIQKIDVYDFGVRISVSKELKKEYQNPVEPYFVREKTRSSYDLYGRRYRLDLTEIVSYEFGKKTDLLHSYEIEIEILHFDDIRSFGFVVDQIFKALYDTNIAYHVQEYASVIENVVNLISDEPNNAKESLNLKDLSVVKNIKIHNMTASYMIGKLPEIPNYSATIKADGLRKLLYIGKQGLYLVYPPKLVNKIMAFTEDSSFSNMSGTVLEGEYIQKGIGPITFLIYDILSTQNDPTIRNHKHEDRIKYVTDDLIDQLKLIEGFNISVKTFYFLRNPMDFFNSNEIILHEKYPFNTDGIIFTPNTYYTKRGLVNEHEILKWKPPKDLTIDFKVFHVGDSVELFTIQRELQNFMEVTKNTRHPYNGNVLYDTELRSVPNGSIIEMKWNYEFQRFEFLRFRDDKQFPNGTLIALDVWEDINEPISEEVMTGRQFKLLFKYHNKVKSGIFSYLKNFPNFTTMMSVGSGKGGDIKKWKSVKSLRNIFVVEPDIDNIEIFNQRLNILDPGKIMNIKIINKKVEDLSDTDDITQVHVLEFMFSLGYLTESTIRFIVEQVLVPGGLVVGVAADLKLVEQIFANSDNFVEQDDMKRLNISQANVTWSMDGTLTINVPGSQTAENIVERPVDIKEVFKDLELIEYKPCTEERLLNNDELLFTKMYSSFIFRKK